MSSTFSAKAGSLDRLKVRMRCGCSRCAAQIRCTARNEMPTFRATARPVQCVAPPGASVHGSSSTRATVSAESGGFPGGRVLSPSEPPHRGPADPRLRGHRQHRQPLRRQQDNPGPLDMLLRAVPITDDGGQSPPVLGSNDDAHGLCHAHRFAQPAKPVNHPFTSMH